MTSTPKASALGLVCALLVAGCSGGGDNASDLGQEADGGEDLKVPAGKGAFRGLVVDDALRPIAQAAVDVTGNGIALNLSSDEGGAFAFIADPGVYLVRASKTGYSALQQAVSVTRDGQKPVYFQLPVESSLAPYWTQHKAMAFLECSAGGAAVCGAPEIAWCIATAMLGQPCPELREDATIYFIDEFFTGAGRIPHHVQVEGVWDATQPAAEALNVAIGSASAEEWQNGTTGPFFGNHDGQSPMVARFNLTELNETSVGVERGIWVGLYSGSNVPLGDPAQTFTGAAVNQRVDLYITAFYGYTPDAEWVFVENGSVPGPP